MQSASTLLTPPPRQTTWEWCESHVILPPQTTNRPGPWRSEVTPYVRGVMDCLQDPLTTHIIMIWSAQTAKTQTIANMALWMWANNPMNTVWMMPSTDLAKSFSKSRLDPMIKACAPVADKISENRHEDNYLEKLMDDMTLNLVGGNSPANLSSRPAGFIVGDEIDKLPRNLSQEACPVALIVERTKTYQGRKKIILATTPTTRDGKGWFWLEDGTYDKYYWPCPHCHEKFTPEWRMVKWARDEGMSHESRAKGAYIECPHCRSPFYERHKRKALLEGEWRSTQPDKPKTIRSFHISEIQSPFTPLADLVVKFLKASEKAKKGDTGDLQNFVNSSLAEPWEEGAYGRRKPEELRRLMSHHPMGVVPNEARWVFFGADTQDNGFWYRIRAFGNYGESWGVKEGFVDSLAALEAIIRTPLPCVTGPDKRVDFGVIDAGGHRTDEVRKWCAKNSDIVLPCFGRVRLTSPVTRRRVDAKDGTFGGQEQLLIDTKFFKDAISQKLKINPGDPGGFHIHAQTPDDWFLHMVAEYVDEKMNWTCPKHVDNHLWDCEVYAAAAAYVFNAWNATEESYNVELPERRPKEETPAYF